ncbi:MAG: DUF2284 domain-containing protein [Eubacteriales bacterium]|nr:DUF2284 domain-containing protein [Eubacteriales bacterium]
MGHFCPERPGSQKLGDWFYSCRFPEKAISYMEAYWLFVTQVCRDNHLEYYYVPKTITYTACVLL